MASVGRAVRAASGHDCVYSNCYHTLYSNPNCNLGIVSYSYVSCLGLEYALAMKQGLVFGFRIRPAVEQ